MSIAESAAPADGDKSRPCPLSGSVPAPYRPPTSGCPVTVFDGGEFDANARFAIRYRDEQYFFAGLSWARFGRDDEACEIVIWEELCGTVLSRTAGELWCMDDDIWVRNLSTTHELVVAGRTGPPQLLAPRLAEQRGRACSLPGPSVLSAPSTGDWQISVRPFRHGPRPSLADDAGDERTWTVGPVPDRLRPFAAAMCAPILLRGASPASYAEIAAVLGITLRQARRSIDKLCDHYSDLPLPERTSHPESGRWSAARLAELLVARGRIGREDLRLLRSSAVSNTQR